MLSPCNEEEEDDDHQDSSHNGCQDIQYITNHRQHSLLSRSSMNRQSLPISHHHQTGFSGKI